MPGHARSNLLLLSVALLACSPEQQPAPEPSQTSPWHQPAAPDCPEMQQGLGAVWLDDPAKMTLEERPLHCLAGDGRLQGRFVSTIQPEGQPALGNDGRFFFDLADPRLQQVQVYYALTGMAGHYQPAIDPAGALPSIRVELRPTASFTISRYDWPDRLRIAADGVMPAQMVPLQVLCHEYGHHLILAQGTRVDQVLNEGLADYLAADFTENPRILALERLELPAALLDSADALSIARRYLERSVDNQRTYPADVVTQQQYCETLGQAAAVFPVGSPLVPTQKLEQCKEMTAEQLEQHEPHRTGMIIAGALWELRGALGSATLNGLLFAVLATGGDLGVTGLGPALLQADLAQHDGVHAPKIQAVLQARGLL